MKHITPQTESKLFEYLRYRPIIDHGASRMLFAADETVKEILGLDQNMNCVIKVAIGLGGMKQNNAEADMFSNYGDSDFLAKIYLIGRYTIVMEEVDPDDYRDMADEIGSNWEDDFDYYCDYEEIEKDDPNYATLKEAAKLIGFLADKQGCTADNGQIGSRADGKLVAYDYGYSIDFSTDSQTSRISDCMDDGEDRLHYLEGLMNILNQEGWLMSEVDRLLHRLECSIAGDDEYYEEDDEENCTDEKDTAYWEREDTFDEEEDYTCSD